MRSEIRWPPERLYSEQRQFGRAAQDILALSAVASGLSGCLGEQGEPVPATAPDVQFEFAGDPPAIKITHNGGPILAAADIRIAGEGIEDKYTGTWAELSGTHDPESNVAEGDSVVIRVKPEY